MGANAAIAKSNPEVAEKLWFRNSIDGLLKGLTGRLTPRLLERMLSAGLDVNHLLPEYSCETVRQVVDAVGEELFASASKGDAHREVGKLFIEGYGRTLVGGAMLQLMRIVGPRKTLERMQRNFRTGSNFIETRFTSLGPKAAEIWFNDSGGVPDFIAGIIAGGGAHTGAKNTSVNCSAHPDGSCVVRVDWVD